MAFSFTVDDQTKVIKKEPFLSNCNGNYRFNEWKHINGYIRTPLKIALAFLLQRLLPCNAFVVHTVHTFITCADKNK